MAEQALNKTLDTFPGGLLVTDLESRVVYASAALEKRTGFAVAEIVGKKPGQLWGGRMRRKFYTTLWHTIGTECQPFVGEVKNTKKNGAKHDEHIYILPIRDENGMPRYYAEVHPELVTREDEVAFGREFLQRTRDLQDQPFFTWMFQKLGQKKDGTGTGERMNEWQTSYRHPAQFFEEHFILPTERTFARRREDALLIAEAQADPKLFAALYEKYARQIREYFVRRLEGDRPLSEDLTQEVFVRAFHYIAGFQLANASYYTYLLHVAHSVLVNYYRKERLETWSLSGNETKEIIVSDPYAGQRDLDTLLAPLSEGERHIMLLKYREGLKIQEIAKRLGKSENAIKLLLSRTRKKLKKAL